MSFGFCFAIGVCKECSQTSIEAYITLCIELLTTLVKLIFAILFRMKAQLMNGIIYIDKEAIHVQFFVSNVGHK